MSNAGSESFEIDGDRRYLTAALPVRKEFARWRSHPGEPTLPKIAVDARGRDCVGFRATEEGVSSKRPIVVLVSAGSADNAGQIARALVEERLAACVSIVPGVRSIYRWEGQIVDDAEWLLVIKTERKRFAELEARVRALHAYTIPEVIALEIVEGSKPYLDWLLGASSTAGG